MKIVIVLDRDLPLGLLTNAAAVLAFSAARHLPGSVGHDLEDADGDLHPGITNLPVPILACPGEDLSELRRKARTFEGVRCIDFSQTAQRAKRYDAYEATLKATKALDLTYLGLCLYGEPASVRRLTGHLALVK